MKCTICLIPLYRSSAPSHSTTPSTSGTPWLKPSMDGPSPGWSTGSMNPWRIRFGQVRLCWIPVREYRYVLPLYNHWFPMSFWYHFLSGQLKEDSYRAPRHIWLWSFLCKQVGIPLLLIPYSLWDSFWEIIHEILFAMTNSFQFRAVLYKLLQWEAAAALHPVDSKGRAGGVRGGGYRGKSNWI